MDDALVAFGLVFLAELGDKSMLLAAGFAARYRPWPVLAGIATAALVAVGVSVLIGSTLGAAVPDRAVALIGGVIFLGFGVWTLLDEDDEDGEVSLHGRSLYVGVTAAFLVAEIGDKTSIAAIALGGAREAAPVWLGGALGMTAASGLAILVTALAGSRLPQRTVRTVAAGAFLVFGALLIAEGVAG